MAEKTNGKRPIDKDYLIDSFKDFDKKILSKRYTNVDMSSFMEKMGTSSEDTPVGHIIPYMGNNAPDHYLACDGTEYNITDYQELANHFINEFGSVNHFGGDGNTTFAVPDLRGEFLRGTGTASRNTGSGAAVGAHQNATVHPNVFLATTNYLIGREYGMFSNMDTSICTTKARGVSTSSLSSSGNYPSEYTSRPTNTSVLYCIKYEHTYFCKFADAATYSYDEHVVGKWVDGKTLYEKTIYIDYLTKSSDKTSTNDYYRTIQTDITNVDVAFIKDGFCDCSDGSICILPHVSAQNVIYNINVFLNNLNSQTGITIGIRTGIERPNDSGYVTIQYTKK